MRRREKRRGLCFEGTADEGKAIQASAETTLSNQRRPLFAVTSAATTEGGEALSSRCGTCYTVAKILQTSAALHLHVNASMKLRCRVFDAYGVTLLSQF